ncbi:G1/S-specific cyclin Ccn1p [Diutina catenulata]
MNHPTKYGPPPHKPRSYHPTLEALESMANKRLMGEYQADVVQTLADLEGQSAVNPAMIDLQPEIQWFMRPFLLDFLIELHASFKLQPQTLFLCLNIIDRYCAKRIVFKRHYQLVGCTALWIAGKYEDKKSRVPTLKELTIMCRNAYDEEMFVQMEMHILSTLEWSLSHPNLEECLQLAIAHSKINVPEQSSITALSTPKRKHNSTTSAVTAVGRFLCELSMYDRFFMSVPTSLIAITANLLACSMLQLPHAADALRDLMRKNLMKRTRMSSSQTLYSNNNTSNYSHSHFGHTFDPADEPSYLMDQDATDDDDDIDYSDDEFVDVESEFVSDDSSINDENCAPTVQGAFLSGFDEEQLRQIKAVAVHFIGSLSNITEVLTKKYEPLGVIQVIQNFHSRYSYVISCINESPAAKDSTTIPAKLYALAEILLQFPKVDDGAGPETSPLRLNLHHPTTNSPATPPSATSQYSVFSNKRSSTTSTPIYSSYTSGSSLSRTRSKICKHKAGSQPTFTEYSPTSHKFRPALSNPSSAHLDQGEWPSPITNHYS